MKKYFLIQKQMAHMFPVLFVVVTLIFSVLTPPTIAHAAGPFNVNSTADTVDASPGDGACLTAGGVCTLRAAIQEANVWAGNDTITFAGNYTITLGSQLPAVTTTITINGNGVANTIIQANAAFNTATYRVFEVTSSGNLTLNNLTIQNGRCNGACATITDYGGGIFNAGALTITNSMVANNSATNFGGGIFSGGVTSTLTILNSTFSGMISGAGGAIYNGGIGISISNSTFSGNFTQYGGGAIYNSSSGPLTITNSTFSGNTSNDNRGGAIYSSTPLTISNSTFSGNSADVAGGGIYTDGPATLYNTIVANNTSTSGGGNCDGTVTITNGGNNIDSGTTCGWGSASGSKSNTNPLLGTLADNGGPTQTFGLLLGSPAVDAGNDTICSASPVGNLDQRGFSRLRGAHCDIGSYERAFRYVATTGSDTANNCTDSLSPCQTIHYAIGQAVSGDAIYIVAGTYTGTDSSDTSIQLLKSLEIIGAGMNLTILDGGGIRQVIYIPSGITSSLKDLTIQNGNKPAVQGGGIYSGGTLTLTRVKVTGNSAGGGGGIKSDSVLTMTDSIVSNNITTGGVAPGGGIWIDGGTANLTNTTISGNIAALYGGGIHIQSNPTVNLTNVTISGNTAQDTSGGGAISIGTGTINILNSTIANNHASAFSVGGIHTSGILNIKNTIIAGNDGVQCFGALTSQGYNLSSDATCSFTNTGDQQNADPLLGPLASNGGPTQTHALLSGSPAIDAGTTTGCPLKDQRGVSRPQGAHCDIGAYEYIYQLFLPLIRR
jgi:large repetitive protein